MDCSSGAEYTIDDYNQIGGIADGDVIGWEEGAAGGGTFTFHCGTYDESKTPDESVDGTASMVFSAGSLVCDDCETYYGI